MKEGIYFLKILTTKICLAYTVVYGLFSFTSFSNYMDTNEPIVL